jgi:hypothetical protein
VFRINGTFFFKDLRLNNRSDSRVYFFRMYYILCTLVQALRLCTGRTAHRRSRGIALPFLDHCTRREWGVSVTPRPLFTSGKDPVPIVQEAGWTPGPVWTSTENLAATGIRFPDRAARISRYTDWGIRPTLNISFIITLIYLWCGVFSFVHKKFSRSYAMFLKRKVSLATLRVETLCDPFVQSVGIYFNSRYWKWTYEGSENFIECPCCLIFAFILFDEVCTRKWDYSARKTRNKR